MGNIIGSRQVIAPMFAVRSYIFDFRRVVWIKRMVIFTLGKQDFAETSAAVDSAHFLIELHERIIFGEHIDCLALFGGADKRDSLRHSAVACTFAQNMDVFFKRTYRVFRVFMEKVAQKNRFQTWMVDKFIEACISGK